MRGRLAAGSRSFGIINFSNTAAQSVARVTSGIQKEVPEASVCGIVHECGSSQVASPRIVRFFLDAMREMGGILLRFVPACPPIAEWARPIHP